jgi:metal-responsive CopG/Arc/MetJ family transcriptional regulator
VKTAISIPDDTFDLASQRARELGLSRSEFFARAARHYLDELDTQSITHQIDSALAHLDVPDSAAADAVEAGHRTLARADDDW